MLIINLFRCRKRGVPAYAKVRLFRHTRKVFPLIFRSLYKKTEQSFRICYKETPCRALSVGFVLFVSRLRRLAKMARTASARGAYPVHTVCAPLDVWGAHTFCRFFTWKKGVALSGYANGPPRAGAGRCRLYRKRAVNTPARQRLSRMKRRKYLLSTINVSLQIAINCCGVMFEIRLQIYNLLRRLSRGKGRGASVRLNRLRDAGWERGVRTRRFRCGPPPGSPGGGKRPAPPGFAR